MVTDCPSSVAPPTCCQPAPLSDAEWNERTARLREAQERARAAQPAVCPRCHGADIAPVFDPDGAIWTCEAAGCGNVWEDGR